MRQLFSLSLALLAVLAPALGSAASPDPARGIAAKAAAELERGYVFPARAREAAMLLRSRANAGAYDGLTGNVLATKMTSDLAGVLHDKHVRIRYSEDVLPASSSDGLEPSDAEKADMAAADRHFGYGFASSVHMDANVGYLKLGAFAGSPPERDTVIDASVNAVAYSDAVILDLRDNHGGDPAAVARLLSHFLPSGTHLNDFIGRGDDEKNIRDSTFTTDVPGPTISAPLYVLTSHQTFSGAEECAYDLQALKRATIVGETTGGGANPGRAVRIDDHFSIFVPDGRARNPITGTNWEGVGVKPDVAVVADRALATAFDMALARIGVGKSPRDAAELQTIRKDIGTQTEAQLLGF